MWKKELESFFNTTRGNRTISTFREEKEENLKTNESWNMQELQ